MRAGSGCPGDKAHGRCPILGACRREPHRRAGCATWTACWCTRASWSRGRTASSRCWPRRVGASRPHEQLDVHPRDLCDRLAQSGLVIPEASLWTSALATAQFLDSQRPNGKAYVIGEAGLTTALHDIGYVLTDRHPSTSCSARRGPTASRPSPRPSGWWPTGPASSPPTPTRSARAPGHPACVRLGGGPHQPRHRRGPYFVGKPNSLMVREASTRSARTPNRRSWWATAWTPTWSPASRRASRPSWSSRGHGQEQNRPLRTGRQGDRLGRRPHRRAGGSRGAAVSSLDGRRARDPQLQSFARLA